MLKQGTREIGGKTYQIVELSAKPGRAMLIRLLRLAGPSVSAALRSLEAMELSSLTAKGIADAIQELLTKLTPEEFEEICGVFLAQTQVLNPDTGGFMALNQYNAFAGDYGNLLKLLRFHVEFNYSSFLDGLGITTRPN